MRGLMQALAMLPAVAGTGAVAERPAVRHYSVTPKQGESRPFSAAVRVGDTLYLSGQIGVGADGVLAKGLEGQTRQMFSNITATLALAGRGMDDVFHCTVMLENMADWPAFNRIYVGYFKPGRLPARSAFGTDGLALGALVEMECQAHAPER